MDRDHQISRIVLATGMIALGVLGIVYGDFALQWQPVPASLPFRTALAYVAAIVMLAGGIALLFRKTTAIATRVLFAYLVLWVLLRASTIAAAPSVEATWLGVGEIVVLMTGGWVLFARYADLPEGSWLRFATGARGIRGAQLLFGVALIPIGLSHIVYIPQTAALVPAWLPDRTGWAYLTGAGQIAAGLGVLFSILPRVAAVAEASMLTLFTLLVWVPAVVAAPTTRLPWTALCMSWAIAASAWVIAGSMPRAARPAVDESVLTSRAT
ncbi:MAG TPA: hypothetical protein VFW98_05910 [Gemmatimonadaceae bacterium]|nr:hypothetical protein [Gemmatimonadaceae bacterium]